MITIDENTKSQLVREIAMLLAKKQRLSFASDFHAFAEGRQLSLAGVTFDKFSKGPDTKRSDGDVISHAIVMALAGATNTGDIDDWFPDHGEIGVRSIEYLPDIRKRLIEANNILIGTVDITILCGEQPRMKKRLPEMQQNIAKSLGINSEQVHVKVTSMDGQDEVARLEGIEARVLISLWEGL
jgi:2-C-methyl-D-erythritol 2,4-cyclodiphosphate synthase